MLRFAVALLLVAGIAAIAKAEDDPAQAKTPSLAEALDAWIVLLEADNLQAAQKKWAKDATASEKMKERWTNLKDCHKKYDYRKWLEQAKQIGDGTKFTVGGHDYGHMHTFWEKTARGWRITNVMACK